MLPAVLGHVGLNAGRDRVVDRADDLDGNAVSLHDGHRPVRERAGVGGLRGALERAVDVQGTQIGEVPARLLAQLLLHGGEMVHRATRPYQRVSVAGWRSSAAELMQ